MEKMNNVHINDIRQGDLEFVEGTYHGIKVIERVSDRFINATKLCNQFNRKFRKIHENHAWQAYLEEFKLEYACRPEMGGIVDEVKRGYKRDLAGSYVDRRLVNYIAIWASPKYAIKVGKIMDAIDERNKLTNQTLDETIKDLQKEVEELRKQLAAKSNVIEAQDKLIDIQDDYIEHQKEDIFQNHNRTTKYNDNHLWVFQDPKNQSNFKITVNQSKNKRIS